MVRAVHSPARGNGGCSAIVNDISLRYRRRYKTIERGEAPCMKSVGAVCEMKAGDRRPGQAVPSGGRGPGEARASAAASAETPGSGPRATSSAARAGAVTVVTAAMVAAVAA